VGEKWGDNLKLEQVEASKPGIRGALVKAGAYGVRRTASNVLRGKSDNDQRLLSKIPGLASYVSKIR
jgi:hypothetical protein